MAFEIRYYNANSNKDDIEFVTEFLCFLEHLVCKLFDHTHFHITGVNKLFM